MVPTPRPVDGAFSPVSPDYSQSIPQPFLTVQSTTAPGTIEKSDHSYTIPAAVVMNDDQADAALQKLASTVMLQSEEWMPVQSSYVQFYYFFPYWQFFTPVYRRRRSKILRVAQGMGNVLLLLVRCSAIGIFLTAEIYERITSFNIRGMRVDNYYIYLTVISFYVFFFYHALAIISTVVVFSAKTFDNLVLKPHRRNLQKRQSDSFIGSFLRITDTSISSVRYKTKTDKIMAYAGLGLNIFLEFIASLQFVLAALSYTSAIIVTGGYWASYLISKPIVPLSVANYMRHGAQVIVNFADLAFSGCTLRFHHVFLVGAYAAAYMIYYGAMEISGALARNLQPYSGLMDVDKPLYILIHLLVIFGFALCFIAIYILVGLRLRLLRLIIYRRYDRVYKELKRVELDGIVLTKGPPSASHSAKNSQQSTARGQQHHRKQSSYEKELVETPKTEACDPDTPSKMHTSASSFASASATNTDVTSCSPIESQLNKVLINTK